MPLKIPRISAYPGYSISLEQQQRKFVELAERCRKSLTPDGLADEYLFSLVCDLLTEKKRRKDLIQNTPYDAFLETLENEIGYDVIKLVADLNAKQCLDLASFSANLPGISKQRKEYQRLHELLLQHITALQLGLTELQASAVKIQSFQAFQHLSLAAQLEYQNVSSEHYAKNFHWFFTPSNYGHFNGWYMPKDCEYKNGYAYGGTPNTLSHYLYDLQLKSKSAMKPGPIVRYEKAYSWPDYIESSHPVHEPKEVPDLKARRLAAEKIPVVEAEMKLVAAYVTAAKAKCEQYFHLANAVPLLINLFAPFESGLAELQQWRVSDGDKNAALLKIHQKYKDFLQQINFNDIDIKNDLETFGYTGAEDFFRYLDDHYKAIKTILDKCVKDYPDKAIFSARPETELAAQALQKTMAVPLRLEDLPELEEEKMLAVESSAGSLANIELNGLRHASAALRAVRRDSADDVEKEEKRPPSVAVVSSPSRPS